MATKRPISIQIPEELKLTKEELNVLENRVFVALLAIEGTGPLQVPPPINTKPKTPVEFEFIGSPAPKDRSRAKAKKGRKRPK